MLLVFVLYALFASVFTVAKGALVYASPFFLVGSRMMLAGGILLGYAAYTSLKSLRLDRQSLIRILLLGFLNIYLTNVLELWGLKYLSSFKACLIYSFSPFLSALVSYVVLGESLSKQKWIGLIIGFIGIWPVTALQNQDELRTGMVGGLSGAEGALLLAVVSSVLGWTLLRQLVHDNRCSPVVANGYSMLFGGVLATLHSLAAEPWAPLPITDYAVWAESTLFLLVVSNFAAYNLYGHLLKRFSPTFMAFAGLSTPLFTAVLGSFFHGEAISLYFFVALAVVFIGLFIFYFDEIRLKQERLPVRVEAS